MWMVSIYILLKRSLSTLDERLLVKVPGRDELRMGPGQREGGVCQAQLERGVLPGVLDQDEPVLPEDAC